jgi:hypothetical protein
MRFWLVGTAGVLVGIAVGSTATYLALRDRQPAAPVAGEEKFPPELGAPNTGQGTEKATDPELMWVWEEVAEPFLQKASTGVVTSHDGQYSLGRFDDNKGGGTYYEFRNWSLASQALASSRLQAVLTGKVLVVEYGKKVAGGAGVASPWVTGPASFKLRVSRETERSLWRVELFFLKESEELLKKWQ